MKQTDFEGVSGLAQGLYAALVDALMEMEQENFTTRVMRLAELDVNHNGKSVKSRITMVVEPAVFGKTNFPPDDVPIKSSVVSQLKQMEELNAIQQ